MINFSAGQRVVCVQTIIQTQNVDGRDIEILEFPNYVEITRHYNYVRIPKNDIEALVKALQQVVNANREKDSI